MKNMEKENKTETQEDKNKTGNLEKLNINNLGNNLTFIDGVLVTWKIYDKILKKNLIDENGEQEKDKDGFSYLRIINDDINDYLLDGIIKNEYFENRKNVLMNQFEINI